MKNNTIAIILAAGDRAHSCSSLPIAMHKISDRPIIEYSIRAAQGITASRPLMILGDEDKEVGKSYLEDVDVIWRESSLEAGNIPKIDWGVLANKGEYGLLIPDNLPLISPTTLMEMLELLKEKDCAGVYTPITSRDEIPILGFRVKPLLSSLKKLKGQGGNYTWEALFDLMKTEGKGLRNYNVQDKDELTLINNGIDQAKVQREMTLRINNHHLSQGVTIVDPYNTYIGANVKIQKDVTIYPGNHLEGNTIVGEGTVLYPNNRIVDSILGQNVNIEYSVILESHIEDMASIGPFAYLRPDSKIGPKVKIGDFVEVKNTEIGQGTKISHLSYIGDAIIGKDVNIGGGVIFVNYDGHKKHKTHVEDNAFIGCNTNLVAPVKVGREGYIAAGSTITDEVPNGALSIARARQVNKEGWVEKRNDSRPQKHENEMEENQ